MSAPESTIITAAPATVASDDALGRAQYAIYLWALAGSILTWFIAIHSPLWLDETDSYWQISAGLSQIWHRQFESLCFPAYTYILWLFTKIIGTSEVALRVPSVLAMLGAVYLLYLAAREFFNRETALLTAVIFAAYPAVIFAATDARPYAFGLLATNATIITLFRLRRHNSNLPAALFGLLAASILYFHFLYAVILPALVLCLFIIKAGDRKTAWRQLSVAAAVFAVAFLPTLPGLRNLFLAPGTHGSEPPTPWARLVLTLTPLWMLAALLFTAFTAFLVVALKRRQHRTAENVEAQTLLNCASLALIPILLLYGVSAATSIHVFVDRHCLEAVPGIALCWALAISRFRSPAMRVLFCVALVAFTAVTRASMPEYRQHKYSWKYALDVAEKNAAQDNAPVLICSNFAETNYTPLPPDPKTSHLFAPLSYYQLSVPVVPLPRTLDAETMQTGSSFIRTAAQKHQRFLALEFEFPSGARPSYPTLEWLTKAAGTFEVRDLGTYDYVKALEFTPRPVVQASR